MVNVFNKNRNKPKVIINDIELKNEIGRWLGVNKNIINVFSKLLLNVGFNVDDEIVLYKYFYMEDNYLSFSYIVNGKNPYKKNVIMLEYGKEDSKPSIIVYTGSKNTRSKIEYEVNREKEKYTVVSKTFEDKRYGMLNRIYYDDKAIFFVEKNDYELCLYISKSDEVKNEDWVYKLRNEKELVSYLNSLVFPVDIDLVYKKICEISLGDINMYPEFCLKVTKYDTLENLEEVTDIIELEDGNLISFGMSKDGKNVVLYGDGSWCYEKKLSDMTAVVQYEDDEYMYGSITDGGFGNEVKQINKKEIRSVAIKDIEETKRLVRRLLNRSDRKYDR